MKAFVKTVAVIAALLMLYGLAVVGVNAIFNRTGWLYREYAAELDIENQTGITPEEASLVLTRMMYYAEGRDDDLDVMTQEYGETVPFFNESELSHMRDVRALTTGILRSGAICLILSVIVLILLMVFKQRAALRAFAKALLIAAGVAVVIIIALAIWILIDFDGFWTMFHKVFFARQGNWTFDPAESRMIRICPAGLFADFVGRLGTYVSILVGAAVIICVLYLIKTGRKPAEREK